MSLPQHAVSYLLKKSIACVAISQSTRYIQPAAHGLHAHQDSYEAAQYICKGQNHFSVSKDWTHLVHFTWGPISWNIASQAACSLRVFSGWLFSVANLGVIDSHSTEQVIRTKGNLLPPNQGHKPGPRLQETMEFWRADNPQHICWSKNGQSDSVSHSVVKTKQRSLSRKAVHKALTAPHSPHPAPRSPLPAPHFPHKNWFPDPACYTLLSPGILSCRTWGHQAPSLLSPFWGWTELTLISPAVFILFYFFLQESVFDYQNSSEKKLVVWQYVLVFQCWEGRDRCISGA